VSVGAAAVGVHAGEGLVARFGECLLVVLAEGEAQRDVVPDIIAAASELGAAGAKPGDDLVRRLAGLLVERPVEQQPSVGAVATAEEGIAIFARGDVDVRLEASEGLQKLSGRDAATWIDRIVAPDFDAAVVGPAGRLGEPVSGSSLRSGVVPGSGATIEMADARRDTLEPDEVAPEPPTSIQSPIADAEVPVPGAEREEPTPSAGFVPVALDEPPGEHDEREPLPVAGATPAAPEGAEGPLVQGVLCSRDHFNDPNSLYCATCGISMVHQTHNLVDGPRPALGVMVVDDGSSFVLDADYVVGRDPDQAAEVAAGDARSIVLPDVKKAISRVHARIRLDGWSVTVADAGSANGTFMAQSGDQSWTRVGDAPVPINPGTTVRVGHRTMLFDSHRRRG